MQESLSEVFKAMLLFLRGKFYEILMLLVHAQTNVVLLIQSTLFEMAAYKWTIHFIILFLSREKFKSSTSD